MKVLSIDLDYIMGPTIQLYNGLFYNDNPTIRWRELFSKSDFKENHFYIDQSNLMFCFNVFLKALKNCQSVSFGYEHDSILFSIKDYSDIDLINIDHHDDVFGGDYTNTMPDEHAYSKEYFEINNDNRVHEGNWGAWLASKNKLKSFTWIGNNNSSNKIRNSFNCQVIPNYLNVEKEDYKFTDYNFDHIFVCLSPQYVPKNHWHYFAMFISAFEEIVGKDATIITQKFETQVRNDLVHNEILYQRSNGR
jgi:hypothetical protein